MAIQPGQASAIRFASILPALVIGAIGASLAYLLKLPSPWLVGSLLATALAAVAGLSVDVPARLRTVAFLVLAASMGSGVTPETVAAMRHWPLSLLLLMLTVPVLVGVVQLYLTRVAGWERREAMLAAVPGALSYVVISAIQAGIDPRRVALSQTLRLFLVLTLLPFVFAPRTTAVALSAGAAIHAPTAAGISDLIAILAVSAATAAVATWLKVPAPAIMGGLLGSGSLHATGMVTTALPPALLAPALIVTGVAIGGRFAGTRWMDIRRVLPHAFVAIALAVAVCAAGALLAARAIDVPLAQAMLAFAPGGLEAAAVLAFSLGYDPAYVATHQLVRFIGIAVTLPFLLNRRLP